MACNFHAQTIGNGKILSECEVLAPLPESELDYWMIFLTISCKAYLFLAL